MTAFEKPISATIVWKYGALAVFAATAATFATPANADSCSQLANTFHRPNTTITTVQSVAAGTFVTPTTPPTSLTGLPQFCRVAGFSTPTNDSHISFEVWIPETGWNSKFLFAACGGFCGSISYFEMAEPLRRGYAVAATDQGHVAAVNTDANWANGHPQKVIDYGYRADKETTDIAKELIAAYEQRGIARSYFLGCSGGGREALMEAQRYPDDFDGIIVGSPANYWTHLFTAFVWDQQALYATKAGDLSQADLNVLSGAVLAQCVGRDGGLATDKFLNNPPACHFDPSKLLCNGKNGAACLSQDKITAIEKIFSGPPGIFPGFALGGDEANLAANWPAFMTGGTNPAVSYQALYGNGYFENMVFPNTGWTPETFSADYNAAHADAKDSTILNSIDPDLNPFKSHGGKMIQYVGWSDPIITPQNDINYHKSVAEVLGKKGTAEFYRLFVVPGMGHCGGGPGANAFGQGVNGPNPSDPADDILSALDRWVESSVAPESITATKYVNDDPTQGIAFQRPLCTYPKFARYKGTGAPTAASSFECVSGPDDDHGNGDDNEKHANR